MSAIDGTIERMTRQRALSVVGVAYAGAALLVAGPWIFTILGIAGLGFSGCAPGCGQLTLFRSIVIYNAMFATMISTPLAFIAARFVAERVHLGKTAGVIHSFLVLLTVLGLAIAAIPAPFYLVVAELDPSIRIAAIENVFLIGTSWLLLPYLGATGAWRAATLAFGCGALAMIVVGAILPAMPAIWLLGVFNAGFTLTNIILAAALVRSFGGATLPDRAFAATLRRAWELPVMGLACAAGIWGDKIVMWFAALPGGLVTGDALRTMPSYDTAMFWAQIATIPVIAIAFVHVQTRTRRLFTRFYGRFDQHASLRELSGAMRELAACVISSVAMLFVALLIVAIMGVLISLVFMNGLGLHPSYMSILRIGAVAMAFYTSAMFCFVFLLYFDLRRQALLLVTTYAVLNPLLTVAILPAGPALYGYGNMLASGLSFILGFTILLRELPWLHYHAFVTNNTSL